MNSIVALFTALFLWLLPAESDSRFTKYKESASSGSFTSTSTASPFTDVTNHSISFKATGRPIMIGINSASTNTGQFAIDAPTAATYYADLEIIRDSTIIFRTNCGGTIPAGRLRCPVGFYTIDVPAAGTYTYKTTLGMSPSATTARLEEATLVVYELP